MHHQFNNGKTYLSSSKEPVAQSTPKNVEETTDEPARLSPTYKAAFEQVKGALSQMVSDDKALNLLLHFTVEYLSANEESFSKGNAEGSAEKSAQRMLNGIKLGFTYGMGENKYRFGSSHKALRGINPEDEDGNTYDYYAFGCDFFRPCMDMDNSIVLGEDNIKKAMDQVAAGENVVFFANHQSEADPQVFSVCLESLGFGESAEAVTYVAGHKVTTDPLAVPFSMGRNLICIHSKKHIDVDPETKPVKQRQNLAAMSALLETLRNGGASIWVAPSGGRDRRNVETREVPIAPFDSKTIDMFRLMANKSKVPTHYYPLAMVSYDLCPPPDYVDSGVGEQRNVRFVPVGIACGEEVASVGGLESRSSFCKATEDECKKGYDAILGMLKKE